MLAMHFCVLSTGHVAEHVVGQTSDRIKYMSHEQEGKVRRLVTKTQGEQAQIN